MTLSTYVRRVAGMCQKVAPCANADVTFIYFLRSISCFQLLSVQDNSQIKTFTRRRTGLACFCSTPRPHAKAQDCAARLGEHERDICSDVPRSKDPFACGERPSQTIDPSDLFLTVACISLRAFALRSRIVRFRARARGYSSWLQVAKGKSRENWFWCPNSLAVPFP